MQFDKIKLANDFQDSNDFQKNSSYEQNYKVFKKFNDPRFGDIIVLQNPKTRDIVFAKEKRVNEKPELKKQIQITRKRINMNCPYILTLLDYSVSKHSELCSSFFILKRFYEYPKNDLKKEFSERQKIVRKFTSVEMTHFFYQQLIAQQYYHSNDLIHGDLQPLFIMFEASKFESKLIDPSLENVNWIKMVQIQKDKLISSSPLYQSPIMYSNLKRGNLKFTFDPKKEEAFALGLILLEAGLGHSIQSIYNSETEILDQTKLQKLIHEFENIFAVENTLVASAVSGLLTYSEKDRPTAITIESNIPKYQEVIDYFRLLEQTQDEGTLEVGFSTNNDLDFQKSLISDQIRPNDYSVNKQNTLSNNLLDKNIPKSSMDKLVPSQNEFFELEFLAQKQLEDKKIINFLHQYESHSKAVQENLKSKDDYSFEHSKIIQNDFRLPNNHLSFKNSNLIPNKFIQINQNLQTNQNSHHFSKNSNQLNPNSIHYDNFFSHNDLSGINQLTNENGKINSPAINNIITQNQFISHEKTQIQSQHYSSTIVTPSLNQFPETGILNSNSFPSTIYYSKIMARNAQNFIPQKSGSQNQ